MANDRGLAVAESIDASTRHVTCLSRIECIDFATSGDIHPVQQINHLFIPILFQFLGHVFGLFFATINNIWPMFPALFLLGLTIPPVNAGISTIVQTNVENKLLGRVSSALHAVMQTSNLLSMFLAGVVAAAVGTRNVFLISGIIVVIAGIAALQIFREYGVGETAVVTTMREAETVL